METPDLTVGCTASIRQSPARVDGWGACQRNSETRSPKSEANSKSQWLNARNAPVRGDFSISPLVLWICLGLRAADFGFEAWHLVVLSRSSPYAREKRILLARLVAVLLSFKRTRPIAGGRTSTSESGCLKQRENQLHSKAGPEGLRNLFRDASRQGRALIRATAQSSHGAAAGPPP